LAAAIPIFDDHPLFILDHRHPDGSSPYLECIQAETASISIFRVTSTNKKQGRKSIRKQQKHCSVLIDSGMEGFEKK
jgi:hypothetical protein